MTSTQKEIEALQWSIHELRADVEAIKQALARTRLTAGAAEDCVEPCQCDATDVTHS